jgi:CBS domain-containing protein
VFFRFNRLLPAVIVVPQETIRNDGRVHNMSMDLPLSVQSALSVREAAIAIRYHGVRYLPVVNDGRLVGIVAFREELRRPRCDPDLGSDLHAGDSAAPTSSPYQ